MSKVVQIGASNPAIIAPCGINCSLCRAYIRERQSCPGCRGVDEHKSNACITCAIRKLAAGGFQFCSFCDKFPCADLKRLEKRYQTKYSVSVIANLQRIKIIGVERFLAEETAKWTCPECGSLLCMHKPQCVSCGHTWAEM